MFVFKMHAAPSQSTEGKNKLKLTKKTTTVTVRFIVQYLSLIHI